MIAFWFIADAQPLRFFVLFVGVMSCLYSLWDIMDDLIFRKLNESDASQFAKVCGGPSKMWGIVWLLVSFVFFAIGIIAGIAVWKDSFQEQKDNNEKFLPTK